MNSTFLHPSVWHLAGVESTIWVPGKCSTKTWDLSGPPRWWSRKIKTTSYAAQNNLASLSLQSWGRRSTGSTFPNAYNFFVKVDFKSKWTKFKCWRYLVRGNMVCVLKMNLCDKYFAIKKKRRTPSLWWIHEKAWTSTMATWRKRLATSNGWDRKNRGTSQEGVDLSRLDGMDVWSLSSRACPTSSPLFQTLSHTKNCLSLPVICHVLCEEQDFMNNPGWTFWQKTGPLLFENISWFT